MKKLFSLVLALMMIFSMAVFASAEETDLAADGWNVNNDNFLGWTKEGDEIVGDFNVGWENGDDMRLWKDMITDFNNFRLEIKLDANNMTSPAISIMGVRIEPDGNGGDGHQVYLKTNNTEGFEGRNETYDWFKAANGNVQLVIARKDGGDLHVLIVGESNDTVVGDTKLLTIQVTNETPTVAIMVYRGCASFSDMTLVEGTDVELPTESKPAEPTEPADPDPTETEPAEPKPTQPEPTDPAGNNTPNNNSVGLIIAIVAVVVAAVVAVIIIRKKKA